MHSFKVGDFVDVRCEVKAGPFSEEKLVEFKTIDGVQSGFVSKDKLTEKDGKWLLRGKIQAIHNDSIEVWIEGSFFNTSGLANISTEIAMAA